MTVEFTHSMKLVARRTGLSPHVIRVWERRYAAVTPLRTGTNRRRYTESEVERLELLSRLTTSGHSISTIAALSTEQLRGLAATKGSGGGANRSSAASKAGGRDVGTSGVLLEEGLVAVKSLDATALEEVLARGSVVLGGQGILRKLIAPLAHSVGNLWREGAITAAHEHFATGVIRTFLGHAAKSFADSGNSPAIVVATPSGQLHELGALLAGAVAANLGWRVTYLGPSLPAAEIACAVVQNRAVAVALSLVYPEDDPNVTREVVSLRRLLTPGIWILVGGRAMPAYREALDEAGVMLIADLDELCEVLDGLRRPRPGAKR